MAYIPTFLKYEKNLEKPPLNQVLDFWIFFLKNLFTYKQNFERNKIEQCLTKYILDMKKENVKVKVLIREIIL